MFHDRSAFTGRRMKRILLISPSAGYFLRWEKMFQMEPLGLLYIAAALKTDHEVSVLDAETDECEFERFRFVRHGMKPGEIRKCISEFSPDIVGVTSMASSQAKYAHEICELTKREDESIITIMGGPHPTCLAPEVLKDSCVDFVVAGEGEATISGLCRHLDAGTADGLEDIPGIAYRKNGEVKLNRPVEPISDLDRIAFPARDLVDMERYFRVGMGQGANREPRLATILTSRGCPFDCNFCAAKAMWGDYRRRSVPNVIEEMELLIGEYGVRELHFRDDNLLCDREYAETLFSTMAERNWDLVWAAPNGVPLWDLDAEFLKVMKASGCYSLSVPVEAASARVRKDLLNKPMHPSTISEKVGMIETAGIETHGFLLIGFPGETRREILDTVKLGRSLNLTSIRFFIAAPLPSTRLREEAEAQNALVDTRVDSPLLRFCCAAVRTPEFGPAFLKKIRWRGWLAATHIDRGLYLRYFYLRYFLTPLRYVCDCWDYVKFLVSGRRRSAMKL